ncbi:MAG: TnpV protein [Blautia sp.]
MELTYQKNGEYYIPNIRMDEQPEGTLTKYGLLRRKYLKENKGGIYSGMLLRGKLMSHLLEIQETAEQRMELLTRQMAESQGVDERLKEENPVSWVQQMNQIRQAAEEVILTELIYR